MAHHTVSITEFKAKCVALINEVELEGGTITITRRGKPAAELGRVKKRKFKSTEGSWIGRYDVPDTVEGFDISHLYEPDPLLEL